MKAVNIKTEYLKNPLGIDIDNPRVMWNCEGGITQTAYRIFTDDWDSGKIASGSMQCRVPVQFSDGKRVSFRIQLWDENDVAGDESEENFFEYGIKNWSAQWITGNYEPDRSIADKKKKIGKSFLLQGVDFLINMNKPESLARYPVDCFRRSFSVAKQIKKAKLYITACGVYEAKINDKRVGGFYLAPGITDYTKRVQYQTYDVTELLSDGDNAITVQLADGWYRGSVGAWGLKQEYGFETKLLAQLELTYTDGSTQTVVTDRHWQWSNDGPIRFADNKDGERVDANEQPSYSHWAKQTSHTVIPIASNNVFVTEKEHFKPTLLITPSGKTVLDMGQNFAGIIAFKLQAKKGQKILLRFGEMLDKDGEFTQKNIQLSTKRITTPLQQIEYICKEGENQYKTTFAVFGYRYVLVETDVAFTAENFTGIAVYSDMEQTGFFDSSNELLNRFVDATVWSTKSNSADLPTDCPTRERHGWTGDAQIFFPSASYLFDYAPFAKKYLTDVYDWQTKDGKLPQIAPQGGTDFFMVSMNGSVGWADAGILIPYYFSKKYNDTAILSDYYDRMKKYADFMIGRIGKNALLSKPHKVKGADRKFVVNKGQAYGEWAEPADVYPNKWTNVILPEPEVATAYTSHVLGLMSEIAETLGNKADAAKYAAVSEHCKKAYQALVETEDFSLDTDRQACLVRPLAFGLLSETQTEYAKRRLLQALENYGYRLGTGFLSTPLILGVLEQFDLESAYKLLENEQMPGWLYMTKIGATTIWESWEGTEAQGGIASLNHYSKGAVCEWLFSSMCGINVSGENHFTINPKPGGTFTFAEAAYNSIFGTIKSGWKKANEGFVFAITVPANCTADVTLPDGTTRKLPAGEHTITI